MNDLEDRLEAQREALRRRCGVGEADTRTVISPYRVCPIGAHIDHQYGPVLGMAISEGTLLVFAPSRDASCRLWSGNFPGEVRFELGTVQPAPGPGGDWGVYARGAAWALRDRLPARARGIVGCVEGTLPGSGLSSSASVLLAYLSALAAVNEVPLASEEMVALSRRAENDFVGVASGILDPASIVSARRGCLSVIDTAHATWECVPLGPGAPEHRVLIAFTGITRNLAATGFNTRVEECREAARRLGDLCGKPAEVLGDLPEEAFTGYLARLPEDLQRRTCHFVGERARVLEGAECWRRGDLEGFGRRMRDSCRSSITGYETGSPEQVRLQEILASSEGVFGSRFSGAGYGGCAVALVAADAAERCRVQAQQTFVQAFPALAERARFTLVDAEDGVRIT